METTKTTLSDLIKAALKARKDEKEVFKCYENGEIERSKLAANALEEALNELIDARINEAIIKHFNVTLP